MKSLKSILLLSFTLLFATGLFATVYIGWSFSQIAGEISASRLQGASTKIAEEMFQAWLDKLKDGASNSGAAYKKALKAKQDVTPLLNEEYKQGNVTLGIIDLKRAILYDKKFTKIIGADTTGDKSLYELPPEHIEYLAKRKGKARFKTETLLWVTPEGKPVVSAVAAAGIPAKGYFVMHANPSKELLPLAEKMDSQVSLLNIQSGDVLSTSELQVGSSSVIKTTFDFPSSSPIIRLTLVQDNAELQSRVLNALLQGVGVYLLFICLISAGVLWLFKNKIALVLTQVSKRLRDVADGKLHSSELEVSLKDEIGQVAIVTNEMSLQLSMLVEDIIGSTNQVSEVMEAFSRSWTEMKEATDSVAQNATESNTQSQQSSSLAQSSKNVLENLNEGFNQINEASSESSKNIEALAEQSSEILEVVEIIQSIAEQTNLLALNASIEAARAGEAGKGFAVVADEVKKLANQTSSSVGTIQETVSKLQSITESSQESIRDVFTRVNDGRSALNETTEALNNIINGAISLNDSVALIATAAEEQASIVHTGEEKINEINNATEALIASVSRFEKV